MVTTESAFLTSLIAAWENQICRYYNISSVFVNTELDEEVNMVLRGDMAALLVKVAPHIYRKSSTEKARRRLLCICSCKKPSTD